MKYREDVVTFSGGFREVFNFNLPIGRAHKHWDKRLYREVREFFLRKLFSGNFLICLVNKVNLC